MSRMIDTLMLARSKHPGAKHSLDALCARFGVDRSQRVKHGALLDAQLLAQVYVELTGGRQIGLSLGQASAAGEAEAIVTVQIERVVREPRPHAPSDEERTRHRGFIARLTSPLWERFLAPV
jgi:DNA polymerase-3 subunit epsilon